MEWPYPYDPQFHRICQTPIAVYLRRESGVGCIVTYWHMRTKRWVVALHNGHELCGIGWLGTGDPHYVWADGELPWCTAENAQRLIRKVRVLLPKSEAKKQIREWSREQNRRLEEIADERNEFHALFQERLRKDVGKTRADEYANRVGLPASDRTGSRVTVPA